MVSKSWRLRSGVYHKKPYRCIALMEIPLIAKGAEVSKIDGGVKIAKKNNERIVQAPR
jgi:hypothetical protein